MRRRSDVEAPELPPLELQRFVLEEWLDRVGVYDPDEWYAEPMWAAADWRLLVAEEMWVRGRCEWLVERGLDFDLPDDCGVR